MEKQETKRRQVGLRLKSLVLGMAFLAVGAHAADKQFGVGQLSEFRISANEVGYVSGVSGLTWSDFAKQTYKGERNGSGSLSYYGFVDTRIVDAEKNSKTDSDDYWCPALTDANLLVWGGWAADAGYADEDALANFFRATPKLIVEAKNDVPQWDAAVYGQNGVFDWYKDKTGVNLWNSHVEGADVSTASFADWLVTTFASADRMVSLCVLFEKYVWKGNVGVGHCITCCGYSIDPTASSTSPARIKGLFIIDSDNDMFNGAGGPSAPDMITYCPLAWTGSGYRLSNVFGTDGELFGETYSLRAKKSPSVNKTSDLSGGDSGNTGGESQLPEGAVKVTASESHEIAVTGPATVTYDFYVVDNGSGKMECWCSGIEWLHLVKASDGRQTKSYTIGDSTHTVSWHYYGSGYGVVENIRIDKLDVYGIVGPADVRKATTLYGCVRAGNSVIGSVELKLGKATASKGSKVSGSLTLFGGKKQTLKAAGNAFLSDGPDEVSLTVGRSESASLRIGTTQDGTLAFGGTYGSYTIESAQVGGALTKSARFRLPDGFAETVKGAAVNAAYLPDGEAVAMNGKKWSIAKPATVKYARDRSSGAYAWVINNGKDDTVKTNLSGLKLTYTAKSGVFKGSFYVYALQGTKMMKSSVAVTGLVVDGVGYGVATLKGVGSYAVEISDATWSDFGTIGTVVSTVAELRQAVANAATGDTIYLKNGQYPIDSSLPVQKSLNFVGESTDGVIITGDETNGLNGLYFGFLSNSSIDVRVLKCTFARMDVWYGANVYFEDCKQTSTANFNGLLCYAQEDDLAASVRAVGCSFRSAVCSMGANASVSVEGCMIDQTGTNAWGLYATEGSMTADSTEIVGGDDGVFAFDGSVVTVNNCVIRNANYAVSSFSGSSVSLTNCQIEGCKQEQRTYEGGTITVR